MTEKQETRRSEEREWTGACGCYIRTKLVLSYTDDPRGDTIEDEQVLEHRPCLERKRLEVEERAAKEAYEVAMGLELMAGWEPGDPTPDDEVGRWGDAVQAFEDHDAALW